MAAATQPSPATRRAPRLSPTVLWLAVSLGLLLWLAIGVGPHLGTFLIVSDEPGPADATFLTYSVTNRWTVRRAAQDAAVERYADGDGPRILIGSLRSQEDFGYTAEYDRAEFAKRYLVRGGVPEAAIEVLAPVDHEYQEAEALRDAVVGRGWRRIVAYAPDFRARRTKGALERALAATGVQVRVVAVRDPDLRLERWWETAEGTETVAREYPRVVYYLLRGHLRV